MKVVELKKAPEEAAKAPIEVLEQLLAEFRAGKRVAFAAVTISPDDVVHAYTASVSDLYVSRLRLQGAIAQLLHDYVGGDV